MMGELNDQTNSMLAAAYVGEFFIEKCRRQAAEKGMRQVALNLKKQGVPFEVVKAILNLK